MAKNDLHTKLTISVAETAKVFDIGINAAYAAVKSGDIPSIRVGGKIAIPTAPLRKLLGIADNDGPKGVHKGGPAAA